MSNETIEEFARELKESELINNNKFRSQFTYVDKNNDSLVDMEEILTWLKMLSKRFSKKEFVAFQMENISAIRRAQEQSKWSQPMDFKMFKSYLILFISTDLQLTFDQFPEIDLDDYDKDKWKQLQIWSQNRVKVSSLPPEWPRKCVAVSTLAFSTTFCLESSVGDTVTNFEGVFIFEP